MSDRFLRGGRLLALGRGPYATDAQHVSVEFVHPVIVGKRALPALDLSILFQPWIDAILRADDIVMGIPGPPEGDPEVWAALDTAPRASPAAALSSYLRVRSRPSRVRTRFRSVAAISAIPSSHSSELTEGPGSYHTLCAGNSSCLLRAPRTGTRRRRRRISLPVSRSRKAGYRGRTRTSCCASSVSK